MKNDTIVLFPNAEQDIGYEMSCRAGSILQNHGRRVVFCPLGSELPSVAPAPPPPQGFKAARLEDAIDAAEMIIAFGGDGTILRAARASAEKGVPILGINMGGKGFIAELEKEDIGKMASLAAGEYKIEQRMMLDVELAREGEAVFRDFALNDIIVRGDNKVIGLTLFGDGQMISRFTGDGAVIATPTGSTAYSMSAGGPIVEPSAQNIIVTPICAHVLEAKPFVLVSDRHVSVEIGFKKHNPAYVSVDGCEHVSILVGDKINVRKSKKHTCLIRLSKRSFYQKVSEKLGERA